MYFPGYWDESLREKFYRGNVSLRRTCEHFEQFFQVLFRLLSQRLGGGGKKKRKKIRENGYFPPLPHPTRGRAGYDLFHDYFPLYHKLSKRCAFETMIKNISMRLLSLSLPPLFYFVSRSTCSFLSFSPWSADIDTGRVQRGEQQRDSRLATTTWSRNCWVCRSKGARHRGILVGIGRWMRR